MGGLVVMRCYGMDVVEYHSGMEMELPFVIMRVSFIVTEVYSQGPLSNAPCKKGGYQNHMTPTSSTTINPSELFAPCLVPSLASSTVPPSPASPAPALAAPAVPTGTAIVRVVTPTLGPKVVAAEAGGCVTTPERDVEIKYPTGNVGQGSVTTFVGKAVPSIFVTGLPYIVSATPTRAGTVKVSRCPSALVAMPMYVVVMTLALTDVVSCRAGIPPAVMLREAEISDKVLS